jgi:hypothetical protein
MMKTVTVRLSGILKSLRAGRTEPKKAPAAMRQHKWQANSMKPDAQLDGTADPVNQ